MTQNVHCGMSNSIHLILKHRSKFFPVNKQYIGFISLYKSVVNGKNVYATNHVFMIMIIYERNIIYQFAISSRITNCFNTNNWKQLTPEALLMLKMAMFAVTLKIRSITIQLFLCETQPNNCIIV